MSGTAACSTPSSRVGTDYVGRFAPSPTGFLHFGSLVAALVSYLDARAHEGCWFVRIEDIDPPREVAGASSHILRQLESHGLYWDGPVEYQSNNIERYEAIIDNLLVRGWGYYCSCTRQQIGAMGGTYNGHCRGRTAARGEIPEAVRVRIPDDTCVEFDDIFQGTQQQRLDSEVGDFIVRRKDGLFAYQLAVAEDDGARGVTHVVRGMDLMDSTARQIWLMSLQGYRTPTYGHLPVALNINGQKLSKQNFAPHIDRLGPAENLRLALSWIGYPSMPDLGTPDEILCWAAQQWQRDRLQGRQGLPAPDQYRKLYLGDG